MASDDLWFVTRWINQMAIVNSEEKSDINNNKWKRSGKGQSMASDSGYAGDADGELLSLSCTLSFLELKQNREPKSM